MRAPGMAHANGAQRRQALGTKEGEGKIFGLRYRFMMTLGIPVANRFT